MRRRVWWGVLAAVSVIALITYTGSVAPPRERPRHPSSLVPDPEGLLGFRRTLERLQIPTETLKDPWPHFAAGAPVGVLLVATPLSRRPDRAEADALIGWISRGGSLLVIDDATEMERSEALDDLLAQAGLAAQAPVTDLDPATLGPARPPLRDARGTPARPSDAALRRIRLHKSTAFEATARGTPLAMGRQGDVLAATMPVGEGTVVRVLGPILANDRVSKGDNLRLALRLIDELAAGGPVWFDEYHHGLGGRIVGEQLDDAVLIASALQALLATLLFALARGVRFGPVCAEPEPTRRSSLEFVRSMASLYRRARARSHVVVGTRDRLVREARIRWGIAENLETSRLATTLAEIGGIDRERVASVLGRAEEAQRLLNMSERTMRERVRELTRLEQEAFGERESDP